MRRESPGSNDRGWRAALTGNALQVATIAFGMVSFGKPEFCFSSRLIRWCFQGIDKPDVRYVVHCKPMGSIVSSAREVSVSLTQASYRSRLAEEFRGVLPRDG